MASPKPEAEVLPSRPLEVDWVVLSGLPPGGIQEALRGDHTGKSAGMRAAVFRCRPWGEGRGLRVAGIGPELLCAWTDLDRGTYLEPL